MIIELSPHISRRIWGGKKLNKYKAIPFDDSLEPVGETWEVSTHQEGISKLKETQKKLSEITDLKYLIKFLDTADNLSVQVHPNDSYSLLHEKQKGKFECWIVLEAEINAGIFLGFKKGNSKNDLAEKIKQKKDASEVLNFYSVKPGDFFVVPPGSIHAIGSGVTMVEVQQSSGVTYRVWDWNRLDKNGQPRELHVNKAFDVLVDDASKNSPEYFEYRRNLFSSEENELELVNHHDFKMTFFQGKMGEKRNLKLDAKKFSALVVLAGKVKINDQIGNAYQSFLINDLENCSIDFLNDAQFILVK